MTIQFIQALSLDKARGLRANSSTLMISILGAQEAQARRRPELMGWRSVLVLEFEDMQEFSLNNTSNPLEQWPMEPTESEHAKLLGRTNSRSIGCVPSLSHAREIIEFVAKHHESDEMLNLIVHCQAGVSRSVMVAHHAGQYTGVTATDARVALLFPHANQRLGRLLERARSERPLHLGRNAQNFQDAGNGQEPEKISEASRIRCSMK